MLPPATPYRESARDQPHCARILAVGTTVPFNLLRDVAFHALGHAYSIGYVVCGVAVVVAALLVTLALGGRARDTW
jgi:hypothetical protein